MPHIKGSIEFDCDFDALSEELEKSGYVKVIRCKDCAIRFDACPMVVRFGRLIQLFTGDEDFCSRGRRENDVDAKGKG